MAEIRYFICSNKFSLQERQTKRGRVYDCVFRVIEQATFIEHQKKLSGFATKTLAKEAYLKFVQEHCEFKKGVTTKKKVPDKEKLFVEDLINEYISTLFNQNKDSTIYDKQNMYKLYVVPYFQNTLIEKIDKQALYKWQDWLWQQKNPRTKTFFSYRHLENIRGYFGTFLAWCESRYGVKNCMPEVQKPKRRTPKTKMKFWTREEFEKFISVVDDPLYHCLFSMLFYTGRRKGELFALTPEDIKSDTIIFDKSITRKTFGNAKYAVTTTKADKSQEIPVCKQVQEELKRYKGESPFFFGGEKPLSETSVTRAFQNYCKKADVPIIRLHDLRHSFASMLIHLGANIMVVADLISDSVEQVQKTYGHLYESDKKAIIDLI